MNLTENDIRRIAFETINELGAGVSADVIRENVKKKIENESSNSFNIPSSKTISGRVILTSFGLNKPGIVAAITKSLGDNNCDIMDLSQKIMGDFFTMIMIIDITASAKDLKEIQDDMHKIAEPLNIKIYLQHEDVFRFMHRI